MNMSRKERLNKIREEIRLLTQMRDELILKSGYSSVEAYYQDLEQRKDKQDNLMNTNDKQNNVINMNDKENKDKQNILINTNYSIDKAA